MYYFINMHVQPCLNTARRVDRSVVILEQKTSSWEDRLKHRVKMVCENASIRVTCGNSPQNNEMSQS
ncbi:hypothetical protein TNCV_5081661 [Trichonephila clavipes]|nr:hypothetical protein TNCV_5081661 [Trichonephila clavipes]